MMENIIREFNHYCALNGVDKNDKNMLIEAVSDFMAINDISGTDVHNKLMNV